MLTNVGAGAIAAGSTDAVNGGELFNALAAIGPANGVQYDNAGHTSVTLNPGGAAAGLHNVAAGTAGTDAVNLSQMQASLNRLDRRANAGTAGAMAALNVPQAYAPGDNMIGGGIGYHGGQVAFAVGASAALDDGHSIVKASAAFGENGGASIGAGFGWHF